MSADPSYTAYMATSMGLITISIVSAILVDKLFTTLQDRYSDGIPDKRLVRIVSATVQLAFIVSMYFLIRKYIPKNIRNSWAGTDTVNMTVVLFYTLQYNLFTNFEQVINGA